MRVRPRFRKTVSLPAKEVLSQLKQKLQHQDSPCTGTFLERFAILRIPPQHQHLWSPELSIETEETPDGTLIRGLFSPKPPVWTFFASLYFFVIFIGVAGGFYGLIQLNLGIQPDALWAVPLSLILLGGAYATAYTGQKLSQEQMEAMQNFLEQSLNE
ncbi:MAG: hypothetical protein DWQ10_07530 [Calditrichaeota bacterium]|nr:MAG: hypothetical protein DWQ10_07530 [Calditrichota bacterium]